jgi:poly(A) polymerase
MTLADRAFELDHQGRVLGRVVAVVEKFVRSVSMARGLSEAAANATGGKIFTFGSYLFGVHGPGTNIDTLCVVPKHVSRDDFFQVFEPMLREVEGITEVPVGDVSIGRLLKHL